jgi:hypothetical protein
MYAALQVVLNAVKKEPFVPQPCGSCMRTNGAVAAVRCCACCVLQVMLNVAKEAPSAFLPHLEALVGRIQQLWDAGQLREGEKVRPHVYT